MKKTDELITYQSLEVQLKQYSQDYYNSFLQIKNRRESDFSTISSKEGEFDTHGPSHILRVQKKLGQLLGKSGIERLNSLELYALLCSICLHDISMGYVRIRKNHPNESAEIIENSLEYKWIDNDIKYIIGDIIRSHGINDLEQFLYKKYPTGYSKYINNERINVGVIMALLRIGDLLDWAYDRAPYTVREGNPVIGESFYFWYMHEPIESIIPNIKEKKILITGRKFGIFACRVLNKQIEMLNAELNSNRQQLAKIDIDYDSFSFDYDTQKKINEILQLRKGEQIFRPFISYNKDEYLKLQGRDKDEEELVRLILKARKEKTVPVLTAESGDGKTSLLKARIMQDFSEMGFETVLFDDVSDALEYFDKLDLYKDIKTKDYDIKWRTKRYLIIIDQMERNFTDDKKIELSSFLKKVKNYIREENFQSRIIYFVMSVPDRSVNQLGQALSKNEIETRIFFLKKVDIKTVITSILKLENIDFDDEIINDITNQLLSTNTADITNVHILFQRLLETNRELLTNKLLIMDHYDSISNMIEYLVKTYFENKFSVLSTADKTLLKRTCNYDGNGTHRVHAKEGEKEYLLELANKNFIRLYNNNSMYEFVHDILAKKFYEDILGDCEKEISFLTEKVHADSLDGESLLAIQKVRDEIVLNELEDSDNANLIFAYMMNKMLIDETDYWMQNYIKPEDIIIKLIKRIEKSINISGMSFINMSTLKRKFSILFSYAVTRHDLDKMMMQLRKISENSSSYRRRCIASVILDRSEYSFEEEEVEIPVCFSQMYHQVLIEPSCESIFLEIYCYLLHYELIDDLIKNKKISRRHFVQILKFFSDFNKNASFFTYEYNSDIINHKKYEIIISLIVPKIVQELRTTDGNSIMELRHGNVVVYNKNAYYFRDGIRTDIHTTLNVETLLKFLYKENVDILFLTRNRYDPILFLKEKEFESHGFFSIIDVTNIVRYYKILCSNQDYLNKFENSQTFYIPPAEMGEYAWLIAKSELEKVIQNKEQINQCTDIPECANEHNNFKLQLLHRMLCYLNYLNLKKYNNKQFERASIILIQTEDSLKGTDLYDNFYLEFEGNNLSQKFDPISISGIGQSSNVAIKFDLITKQEKRQIKSFYIKKEIEFCENGIPAISIGIGSKAEPILDKYRDSFSFQIMWDDKVNLVSQAVDAWEYELNKILVVLDGNPFITDIFVFGNIKRCKKTVQILNKYCKNSIYLEDIGDFDESISMQYFRKSDLRMLEGITLHIMHWENDVSSRDLDLQLSNFFLRSCNTVIEPEIHAGMDDATANKVDEICKEYLQSINAYKDGGINSIQVESIDDAYKAMLASLICYGNKQIDSAGKDILDIRGFALAINDIYKKGYTLSYRRADIDQYYEKQWKDEKGVIKKIADAVEIFNINQIDLVAEKLNCTIRQRLGNRKLAISFYNPDDDLISKLKMPSLLNCFLLPRYKEEECYLDVIFVWRTNECVLGLPMSLEASIRWIAEVLVSKLNEPIKLGVYTYFGASTAKNK